MNKHIITFLLIVFALSFWNCEKDDICAETTPTTPLIVIEFYDFINQSQLKNVTNLGVAESSQTTGFAFNGVSTISIPLKTNEDSTTFNFVLNGTDNDATNDIADSIIFSYNRTNTYISRACGYKTTFQLNETNGLNISSSNWILDYEIVQPNIENNNETHVKIYF